MLTDDLLPYRWNLTVASERKLYFCFGCIEWCVS